MEIPPVNSEQVFSQQGDSAWNVIYNNFTFYITGRPTSGGVEELSDYTKTIGTLVEMAPDSPFTKAFAQLAADIGRHSPIANLNQDLQKLSLCSPPSFTDDQIKEAIQAGFSRLLNLFPSSLKPLPASGEVNTVDSAISNLMLISIDSFGAGGIGFKVKDLETSLNYQTLLHNYTQNPNARTAHTLVETIGTLLSWL